MNSTTMFGSTSRAALRPARGFALRAQPQPLRVRNIRNARFQSTDASTGDKAKAGASSAFNSSALVGGLAGGVCAVMLGYTWYHTSGAKHVMQTANKTKQYFDNAYKKSVESAPEPNQALQWLRETVTSYTKIIPGASAYVDTVFNDIDKVRETNGEEVDKIVGESYDEIKKVTKGGTSLENAGKVWDILQNAIKQLSKLAGGAAEQILDNHPQLKEKVGGRVDQLKQMGQQYGPEAKKAVDETWSQIQDVLKSGVSMETIPKIQNLIQEKTQQVQKYGEQAWQKGLEQAGPLLDQRKDLKELLEKNKTNLLKGNLSQLWEKLQQAAKSGDSEDLKKFVQEQVQQVQKKSSSGGGGGGSGMESMFSMIPGGSELGPKLQQLQELSSKYGSEAEGLVKSAIKDVSTVLSKKVEEGQKLKEKAEKDAKSG